MKKGCKPIGISRRSQPWIILLVDQKIGAHQKLISPKQQTLCTLNRGLKLVILPTKVVRRRICYKRRLFEKKIEKLIWNLEMSKSWSGINNAWKIFEKFEKKNCEETLNETQKILKIFPANFRIILAKILWTFQ